LHKNSLTNKDTLLHSLYNKEEKQQSGWANPKRFEELEYYNSNIISNYFTAI
jgi:hypothetical protein